MKTNRTLYINIINDGFIQLSFKGDKLKIKHSLKKAFSPPSSTILKEQLNWYYEEYSRKPFKAEKAKAIHVEENLKVYGLALFKSVIGIEIDGNLAYDPNYVDFIQAYGSHFHIIIVYEQEISINQNILWELLFDPQPGIGFLALKCKEFYRQVVNKGFIP